MNYLMFHYIFYCEFVRKYVFLQRFMRGKALSPLSEEYDYSYFTLSEVQATSVVKTKHTLTGKFEYFS